MSDETFDPRRIDFRELFPWIHLFRGLGLASDLKKIFLGMTGCLCMVLGWWVIATFFAGNQTGQPELAAARQFPWNAPAPTTTERPAADGAASAQPGGGAAATSSPPKTSPSSVSTESTQNSLSENKGSPRVPWTAGPGSDVFRGPFTPFGWRGKAPSAFFLVLEPILRLAYPVRLLFLSPNSAVAGFLMTGWTLIVWAFFGGAITRIAAVQVARNGNVGIVEAMRFAASRYLTYVGAPILPLAGVAFLVIFCAVGGLLARVPVLNIVLSTFWFLPLAAGLVMAIVLFALALGWPLMYAAISAEATESFDALSRSYSYVLGRPWHYLFYAAITLAYGGIVCVVAVIVAHATVDLSQYSVSWGLGESNARLFLAYAPTAGGWRDDFGPQAEPTSPADAAPASATAIPEPTGTQQWSSVIVGVWTHGVLLALLGFSYSYFWSQATTIFFLLRRDVDETDIEEVFIEEEEEPPFPTVAPSAPRDLAPPQAPPRGSLPIIDPTR